MRGCGGIMVMVMLCWYSDYCMDMNNNVFCDVFVFLVWLIVMIYECV